MNSAQLKITVRLTDPDRTATYGDDLAETEFQIPTGVELDLLTGYASSVVEAASKDLRDLLLAIARNELRRVVTELRELAKGSEPEPESEPAHDPSLAPAELDSIADILDSDG